MVNLGGAPHDTDDIQDLWYALQEGQDISTTIDDVGNDARRFAVRGQTTLYGNQKISSKVPQVEVQWTETGSPAEELRSTLTGSATSTAENGEGFASASSGTDSNASFDGKTQTDVKYLTASESKAVFSVAWTQPPTSSGDVSMIGLSDGEDGFEVGYKGDTFGIRHLYNGSEEDFIPKSEFNGDKLDGNEDSEYERGGEPVPIDHQSLNMWRIRYGWYGVAPTHIELHAPDGHWVLAHKFDFTERDVPHTTKPDLPIRTHIEKNNSDSTDITQRWGTWYGGISANVPLSQQPDGDYVPDKATGLQFSERNLLTANEEFVSDWYDSDGWGSVGVGVVSDQKSAPDGLVIEFTNDVQRDNPDVVNQETYTFTQQEIGGEETLYLILPTQLDGYRVRYKNGDTGQNEFQLTATQFEQTRTRKTNLNTPVPNDAVVNTSRAIAFAQTDADDTEEVKKSSSGDDGGLRVSPSEHETTTPIRADDKFDTTSVDIPDIDGGGPIEPLNGGLSNRTKIRVSNDGDSPVYFGSDNTLTPDNGYQITAGDEEVFPLSDNVAFWMVAADGTGDSTTHKIDATTATGSVAAPEDTKTSNDVRATFQNDGDYVDASGYDASGTQTRNEVSSVDIGFEGKKPSLTSTKQVSHQETTTNARNGGTSITTNVELAADSDSTYLAFVSVNPAAVNVDNVQGLGLSWTFVEEIASGGNEQDIALYKATGTPDFAGRVTANFDAEADSSTIVASRYDNAKSVEASATNSDNTIDWSVITPDSSANGLVISGATINKETSNTPNAGEDELAEETPSSLTTAVQKETTNGGSVTSGGTWGQNGKWSAIGAALEPEELDNPLVELKYEVGTEGVGETTLSTTVPTETDTEYQKVVTSDRAWTYSDLDNTTVTLTYNDTDRYNALIDHIYLEYTEVDTGVTQRVSFMETGRTKGI